MDGSTHSLSGVSGRQPRFGFPNMQGSKTWVLYGPRDQMELGSFMPDSECEYSESDFDQVAMGTTNGGQPFGVSKKLPASGVPANWAKIEGENIVDPLTGTKYSIETGKVVGEWCPGLLGAFFKILNPSPVKLQTYPGKVEDDQVFVLIDYLANYDDIAFY